LLGAVRPNTVDGTIAGNPAAIVVTAAVFPADARNVRRDCFVFSRLAMMSMHLS
jgi:hypothetical protein